jgi:hypothetical protein
MTASHNELTVAPSELSGGLELGFIALYAHKMLHDKEEQKAKPYTQYQKHQPHGKHQQNPGLHHTTDFEQSTDAAARCKKN